MSHGSYFVEDIALVIVIQVSVKKPRPKVGVSSMLSGCIAGKPEIAKHAKTKTIS